MKSAVFASALFASLAFAAPLDKRAYATKTHTVVETVLVYTTVWEGQEPTAAPVASSSAPGAFFEQPPAAVTSQAAATSEAPKAPVVASPAPKPVAPSSAAPVVQAPSPAPEKPSPTPAPAPAPAPEPSQAPAPAPEPSSSPAPAPAPAPSSAPAPAKPDSKSTASGQSFAGSLTMNYYKGGLGACGKPISDGDMVAALAVDGFGASTYDTATGNPTNAWCNQKIRVTYNGKSADAVIMDRCEGCTGAGGLDATPALWEALTGGIGGAAGDRLESGMTFTKIN